MENFAVIMPWAALLLLGALHGINPGMGWLFAVALGFQEERAAAVWRALPPLALGHAAAIAVFVVGTQLIGTIVPLPVLKVIAAAALFSFGLFKLRSSSHPRYGGMRVGQVQLTIWSFIMASAHGAGLMVVPFVLRDVPAAHAHAGHGSAGAGAAVQVTAFSSTMLHTISYLFVCGVIALVVYKKVGLRFLRTGWINLDLVWAIALILTGLITLTFP